jgi:hypothetical protein
MAIKFYFDPAGLPSTLRDPDTQKQKQKQDAYTAAVTAELDGTLQANTAANSDVLPAVVGLLLLGERDDQTAIGFGGNVRDAYFELLQKTTDYSGKLVPNRAIYQTILDEIPNLKPADANGDYWVAYQEFATVGRYVIAHTDEVPLGHPNFLTQIRLGIDSYVAGTPPSDSLDLPPLSGPDGTDTEIEPDNVRAVSMHVAAYYLEQVYLFDTVDRITETFMNGMLPVGLDAGGRALDAYYWDAVNRMHKADRMMQYTRVLGMPGGDVSKEVQPNKEFSGLWIRFLSSLSEYDRRQRIADVIGNQRQRSLSLTGEHVRKAGRDLAANCSLYGYGYTHFAARRLNQHIVTALGILKLSQIQNAYGVSTPWQVIERVAAERHMVPNVVRYRTMAEAGKQILDLVAKYAAAWTSTSGNLLFADVNAPVVQVPPPARFALGAQGPDIPPEDQDRFMRLTEQWLAVTGTKDQQVELASQPEETPAGPSIPSFASNGASSNGAIEQLQKLVSSGQAPSLDQLRQLLPAAN